MSRQPMFKFRLYVAGQAPNSAHAISNLRAFCKAHLKDRFAVEVVDVFREPKRALLDAIFMTPTLLVLAPPPIRRVVGTLSEAGTLHLTLGVPPVTT